MADQSLSELLRHADALFAKSPSGGLQTYNYSLGRFPAGWSFNVTNNWYRWSAAGLQHDFRLFQSPEDAVGAFLSYVKDRDINVAELMGEARDANS